MIDHYSSFLTCPAGIVRHALNNLHDRWDFRWVDIAADVDLPVGAVRHMASASRTTPVPAWVAHRILDFYQDVADDPPRRYPIGPLLHLIDHAGVARQQMLDAAERRKLLHAADRGWLSEWDADRLAVALGHTPHTIWGTDYDTEAA